MIFLKDIKVRSVFSSILKNIEIIINNSIIIKKIIWLKKKSCYKYLVIRCRMEFLMVV